MTTTSPAAPTTAADELRPVTVLEDAKNFTIKHPLQHTWKLWYKEKVADGHPAAAGANSDWQNALKSVDDISTVEDFWGWFNVMPKPSDVKNGGDIFLFHQAIEPSWEDKAHTQGSSFTWTLPRPQHSSSSSSGNNNNSNNNDNKEYLDYWLNAILACIGCAMETGYAVVTGVQFSARDRGSRITLWLRTSEPDVVRTVEAEFRKALTEGLSNALQQQDISLKWEEFSSQLAKQHSHQAHRRPTSSYPSGGQHHGHSGGHSGGQHHGGRGGDREHHGGGERRGGGAFRSSQGGAGGSDHRSSGGANSGGRYYSSNNNPK